MPGLFITLEGIDGCGKTTQAMRLEPWLRTRGYEVVHTFEPGGTAKGQQLREMVLSPDHEIPPAAELYLYLADRAIHVAEVVVPSLARGAVVVCERYTDSTLAYQGYGRGLDLGLLRQLNGLATGGVRPDFTIVIDIPVQAARLDVTRLDRLESSGDGFRARVAEGFRALAAEEPGRIVLVDGTQDIGKVHEDIAVHVTHALARVTPQEAPGP